MGLIEMQAFVRWEDPEPVTAKFMQSNNRAVLMLHLARCLTSICAPLHDGVDTIYVDDTLCRLTWYFLCQG
jgi:hypothetical protein